MRKLVIAMILTVLMAQTAGLPTFAHLTPPPHAISTCLAMTMVLLLKVTKFLPLIAPSIITHPDGWL